ncbi:MAG: hypothetical protein NVV74_03200 [Magnetospirillum sp.]|nr:hypothetical protein [Magnetospirillum sp.]
MPASTARRRFSDSARPERRLGWGQQAGRLPQHQIGTVERAAGLFFHQADVRGSELHRLAFRLLARTPKIHQDVGVEAEDEGPQQHEVTIGTGPLGHDDFQR